MTLDSTSQKTNFLYSIKKHVVDNIATFEGIYTMFDKFLPPDKNLDKWISVMPGALNRNTVSDFSVDIYCVTRKDYEGENLAALLDLVTGYFSGNLTETDSLKRVPFYSAATGQQNGCMVIIDCIESDTMEAPDQSKFVILSITAKMASKI